MNIIDKREKRTKMRKISKRKYDKLITLSAKEQECQKVRLLDEGVITLADGSPDFYIAKGTLEKYLNNLDDNFVGHINLGHQDFATFPILLGKWTKADLSLEDMGDGRKSLYVNMKLDYSNPLVQALAIQDYDIGTSAEFTYKVNEKLTKQASLKMAEVGQPMRLEVLDEIFIDAFAVVGECGNVNSSNIKLKGEPMKLEELTKVLSTNTEEAANALNELMEKLNADEVTEEVTEEVKEEEVNEEVETEEVETEEEAEESTEEESVEAEEETTEEEAAEETEEESEEESTEETEEESSEELGELSVKVEELIKENEELNLRVNELETQNKELSEKLSAKEKIEKEFTEKFKSLKVSVGNTTQTHSYAKPFNAFE